MCRGLGIGEDEILAILSHVKRKIKLLLHDVLIQYPGIMVQIIIHVHRGIVDGGGGGVGGAGENRGKGGSGTRIK